MSRSEHREQLVYGSLVATYDDQGRLAELTYVLHGRKKAPHLRADWNAETGTFDPSDGFSAQTYADGSALTIVLHREHGRRSMPFAAWVAESEAMVRARIAEIPLLDNLLHDAQKNVPRFDAQMMLAELERVRPLAGESIGFFLGMAMTLTRIDPTTRGPTAMRALFRRLTDDRRDGAWRDEEHRHRLRLLVWSLAPATYGPELWRELYTPLLRVFAEQLTPVPDSELASRWAELRDLVDDGKPLGLESFAFDPLVDHCNNAVVLHQAGADAHKAGLNDLARRCLEKAVAIDPNNASARATLQTLYTISGEHDRASALGIPPASSSGAGTREDLQAAIDRYTALCNAAHIHFERHRTFVGAEAEIEECATLERRINAAWTHTNEQTGARSFTRGRIVSGGISKLIGLRRDQKQPRDGAEVFKQIADDDALSRAMLEPPDAAYATFSNGLNACLDTRDPTWIDYAARTIARYEQVLGATTLTSLILVMAEIAAVRRDLGRAAELLERALELGVVWSAATRDWPLCDVVDEPPFANLKAKHFP